MKEREILGASKQTLTLLHIFWRVRTPATPRSTPL